MSACNNILTKLRSALTAGTVHSKPEIAPPATDRNQKQRIEHFITLLEAVHTEVHRTTAAEWPPLLAGLIRQKQLKNLLASPESETGTQVFSSPDISAATQLIPLDASIEENKDLLFHQAEAAITGSRGGIAETGTIVIWPDQHESRSLSLVSPVHILLVEADKIHNTFTELLEKENWQSQMPTNALLVSGPSKTADIQQTLAYGAHGPRELVVLLIE